MASKRKSLQEQFNERMAAFKKRIAVDIKREQKRVEEAQLSPTEEGMQDKAHASLTWMIRRCPKTPAIPMDERKQGYILQCL